MERKLITFIAANVSGAISISAVAIVGYMTGESVPWWGFFLAFSTGYETSCIRALLRANGIARYVPFASRNVSVSE